MILFEYILVILGKKEKMASFKDNWISHADFKSSDKIRLFSDSNFILLGLILLAFTSAVFWIAVILICYFRFLHRFGRVIDYKCIHDYMPFTVVNCIQLHHNQSLLEHLKNEPGLIDCQYKKKSLLHWAAHYKNYEAHKLILALIKERANRKIR